jgi:hypothetical protein
VWDILDQCVRERDNVNNVTDLSRLFHQDWIQITIHNHRKLTRRIGRHIMAVITADGGHTMY